MNKQVTPRQLKRAGWNDEADRISISRPKTSSPSLNASTSRAKSRARGKTFTRQTTAPCEPVQLHAGFCGLTLKPDQNEGKLKQLGGGDADEWNRRLNDLTINALPIAHSKNKEAITAAAPVEGMLIAQLMAANEASLAMYTKRWAAATGVFRSANCNWPTRRPRR